MEQTFDSFCPYPGLRPFNEDESVYFKGRDKHVDRLIELLENKKFLMVTGASGDGKSSLIYAGLIPNVRAGFFKARFNSWSIITMRPGKNPLQNLAKGLKPVLQIENESTIHASLAKGYSALIDLYKNSPGFLNTESENWLRADEDKKKKLSRNARNLFILVDQFEEMFTHTENFDPITLNPSESAATFINLLIETIGIANANDIPIYVVCTMRSDYIGNATAFRSLPELIGDNHYFVPRLNRDEIYQTITEPAKLCGSNLAHRLAQRLLNDLKGNSDVLPVIQHTLYRIWKLSKDGQEELDLFHYAKAGGMPYNELPLKEEETFLQYFDSLPDYKKEFYKNPSLANVLNFHADELFEQTLHDQQLLTYLNSSEIQNALETTFKCLTKIDKNRAVRHRMTLGEIHRIIDHDTLKCETLSIILKSFRAQGNTLLYPYIDDSGNNENIFPDTLLDITHESLIRNWNRLQRLTEEEANNQSVYSEFRTQLEYWKNSEYSNQYLLPVGPYSYYDAWYQRLKPNAVWILHHSENKHNSLEKVSPMKLAEVEAEDMKLFLEKSNQLLTKRKNLVKMATAIISFLFIIATIAFVWALKERNYSEQKSKKSKSDAIAMSAFLNMQNDPTLSLRLAEQAYKIHPGNFAVQALMQSFLYPPFYKKYNLHDHIPHFGAFLKDNKRILTCSKDNLAKLSDVDGNVIKTFEGHSAAVRKVRMSHNGQSIVTCSDDNTAIIWNNDAQMVTTLLGHNAPLIDAQFTIDDKNVITICEDSVLRIFTFEGKLLHQSDKSYGQFNSLEIARDGLHFLTSCEKRIAIIWNVNGEKKHVLNLHKGSVENAIYSQNTKRILTRANDYVLRLWSNEGILLDSIDNYPNKFTSVSFSENGDQIITGSTDHDVNLWNISLDGDVSKINHVSSMQGHAGVIQNVEFIPHSDNVYSSSEDQTLRIWNKQGICLNILKPNTEIMHSFVSSDGKLIGTLLNPGTFKLWNVDKITVPILNAHNQSVQHAVVSPNGKTIIAGSDDNRISMWTIDGHFIKYVSGHTDKVRSLQWSPDGKSFWSISNDNTCRVWNTEGNLTHLFKGHRSYPVNANFSKNGKLVGTAGDDKTARIWSLDNSLPVVMEGHQARVQSIDFSPDNSCVVTASADKTIKLWKLDGELLWSGKGHQQGVYVCSFSPDGKTIASGSADNNCKLWDLKGNCLRTYIGHNAPIVNLEFSKDGKRIISTAADSLLILWDIEGQIVKKMKGHQAMVNSVHYAPDGEKIVSASDDGFVIVWDKNGNYILSLKPEAGGIQDAHFTPDGKNIIHGSSSGKVFIWPSNPNFVLKELENQNKKSGFWSLSAGDKITYGIIDNELN